MVSHLEEVRIQDFLVSLEYFLEQLAELSEARERLEKALENFPLDLYERQVLNLKAMDPGPS